MSRHFHVVFALFAVWLMACADGGADEHDAPLLSLPGDPETAAQSILRNTLAYHSAVHAIYAQVQGELEANPYALAEALNRKIAEEGYVVGGNLDRLADELLEHMQSADEDVALVAEVYHFIHRYSDVVDDPRSFELDREPYDAYIWDAIDPRAAMATIIRSPFPERKERSYYFAPAYNFVASTFLVVRSIRGDSAASLQADIQDTIKLNKHALGVDGDDGAGALTDYVASLYAGGASTREKNDADPVVFSLRRMLAEQEAALQ